MSRRLTALGLTLWLDSGVRGRSDVPPLLDARVGVVVLGLETLRGPDAPGETVAAVGPERLSFSHDLRDGRPLVPTGSAWGTSDPRRLANVARDRGVRRLLLLDLTRVGTGRGLGTLPLVASLRSDRPEVEIAVGGGIAGREDLDELERAGVSAVLVGSVLHDGRIAPGR